MLVFFFSCKSSLYILHISLWSDICFADIPPCPSLWFLFFIFNNFLRTNVFKFVEVFAFSIPHFFDAFMTRSKSDSLGPPWLIFKRGHAKLSPSLVQHFLFHVFVTPWFLRQRIEGRNEGQSGKFRGNYHQTLSLSKTGTQHTPKDFEDFQFNESRFLNKCLFGVPCISLKMWLM